KLRCFLESAGLDLVAGRNEIEQFYDASGISSRFASMAGPRQVSPVSNVNQRDRELVGNQSALTEPRCSGCDALVDQSLERLRPGEIRFQGTGLILAGCGQYRTPCDTC